MVKIARERLAAPISRSGFWLIGGAFLLSLAVLAWALQGDTSAGPTRRIRRPRTAAGSAVRRAHARGETTVEVLASRPPSVGDYEPLLQGNVFQPRVVPRQSQGPSGHRAAAGGNRPGSARRGSSDGSGEPQTTDAWHDWKYNGIAQIDQQTYGLMDQADKKESRFVKVGDHLEDAVVAGVAEKEVTLRAADGSIVRVQRVDAMAELLRAARTPSTPRPAAPASAVPAPTAPIAGPGPVTTFPSGQAVPQAPSAGAAAGADSSRGGSFGPRGRQFQQPDGAGIPGRQ